MSPGVRLRDVSGMKEDREEWKDLHRGGSRVLRERGGCVSDLECPVEVCVRGQSLPTSQKGHRLSEGHLSAVRRETR